MNPLSDGSLRPARGSLMLLVMKEPGKAAGQVFISYVREDSVRVNELQQTLEAAGVTVWRDTAALWPGQDWRTHIRRAIIDHALVFLACFSDNSLTRRVSYQNAEIALALEQLQLRPPDDVWLIPVRFDECKIPDLDLGGGRTLASIQRADLFGERSGDSAARLVAVILQILSRERSISRAGGGGSGDGVAAHEKSEPARHDSPKFVTGIPGLFFVEALTFHPNGRLLAWSSGDGWVSILDLEDQKVVSDIQGFIARTPNGDMNAANHILFSANGDALIVAHDNGYGGGDGLVEIFDWRTRRRVTKFEGPRAAIESMALDPSGRYLTASFSGECIKMWDVLEQREIIELDDVGWLAVTDGCSRIAVVSRKSYTLRVFDLFSREWTTLGTGYLGIPSFSPDGSLLAVPAQADPHIWCLPEMTRLSLPKPRYRDFNEIKNHRWHDFRELFEVVFSPDGRHLVLAFNCGAAIMEIQTGRAEFIVEDDCFNTTPEIACDPTGRWIAVCDVNPPLYLWNIGKERIELIFEPDRPGGP